MNRRDRAKYFRADNPAQWRTAVKDLADSNINNRAVVEMAAPLEKIKNVGPASAMEILTAIALQLAIEMPELKVG